MKKIRFILSFIIALALIYFLNNPQGEIPALGKLLSPYHGFWQNAENETLPISGKIKTPSLKESVNVYFDELNIPHIEAKNELDLFYAQGYITAYHRLWQMEFQMMAAEGRVSEIIGKKAVEYDKKKRRIGLKYAALRSEEMFKKTEPEVYKIMEAYSNGVNDYIASLSQAELPIEYKLLSYKPEKWTPFKSFLLIAYMHDMLSRGERDLEHTNAYALWGKDAIDILYPETPESLDPIIPKGTKFDFEPMEIPEADTSYLKVLSENLIKKPSLHLGSNSFAVNGKKTANGKVILTNEPDLGLNAPSIWYLAQLTCPTINVMGSTLPGAPSVIIGYNDSIAWGNTNAKCDVVDWYKIHFKSNKKDYYKYNDKWVATKKIVEEIKIKGEDSYYDTIVYTHHGPVVYDNNMPNNKNNITNLAMKWLLHVPSKEVKTLYLMNKAKNYDDFVSAFQYFNGPAQNYSFASVSGDIALWVNGKFPVKWKGQGKFVLDGNKPSHEWQAYMPQSHNLHILNPERNFVSSANQHPVDATYPYHRYDFSFEYFRGRRINDRLRLMNNIKVKDMMELQHDNFYYHASEALPLMLDSLDSASLSTKEMAYYTKLRNWDYFADPELKAPSYFKAWWDELQNQLWEEIDSSKLETYRPHPYNAYLILKNNPDFFMVDNENTPQKETATDIIRSSFKATVKSLDTLDADWYKYKNTSIQHLLKLEPFSVDSVQIGGYFGVVNAAGDRQGPSWRMVVELGDGEVNAWGVYPGSQSGNPGNPTYGEMINNWASGKYHKMVFTRELENNPKITKKVTLVK